MSKKKISIGDRMKRYESVSKNYLMRRTPVIIRIDGKAFHSFTRGFDKPFDDELMEAMKRTMLYLCNNIQGCVLGYTQSDEITLVLCDYKTITTDAWFGYNVQKITSISSSMATFAFNSALSSICRELWESNDALFYEKIKLLDRKLETGAFFDSRAFSIPIEEVNNCLIWRQQDAIRNSIQAVAQACFSNKQLEKKNCTELKKMLLTEKRINWDCLPSDKKIGSCCIKKEIELSNGNKREKFIIDNNIPIFSIKPDYVNNEINFKGN